MGRYHIHIRASPDKSSICSLHEIYFDCNSKMVAHSIATIALPSCGILMHDGEKHAYAVLLDWWKN